MKHQEKLRISRRSLFAGLGTTGAASLLGPVLAEAEGLVPYRFLVVHRPCGSVPDRANGCPYWWWPSGTGSDYVTSPLLKAFEPVRANMVVVRGIWCPRNDPANGDKHAQGMIGLMTGVDAYQPPGTSQGDLDDPNS